MCRVPSDPAPTSLLTSTHSKWLQDLSARNNIHPEWLQLLADSPIPDFAAPQRLGTIINVSQCSLIKLVPHMLKANIPIWLYWGILPAFVQPLDNNALVFAPHSHPQSHAPPLPVTTPSQSVGLPTPSQSVGFPTSSQSVSLPSPIHSAHSGPGQLPSEMWKDFMIRQNIWRKAKLSKKNDAEHQAREGNENTAAQRKCPGKKGPTVFIWEDDGGVWTRTS